MLPNGDYATRRPKVLARLQNYENFGCPYDTQDRGSIRRKDKGLHRPSGMSGYYRVPARRTYIPGRI